MDRRTFLQGAAALVGVAAVSARRTAPLAAQDPAGPVLAVVEGEDWGALVAKVLAPLGGMSAFVQTGMRIVVKPNIGWDRTPEQGADTHPSIVKALIQEALAAGAAEVVVFDNPCNEERRCYVNSGIQAAVESIGDPKARIEFMDRRKFVPVTIEGAKSLKESNFYQPALDADCYINVPVAKQHGSSRLTLGLKNTMGVIGGNRGVIHKDIHQRIAELNTVIRPKLTVIDATRIMLDHGPSSAREEDIRVLNTVIASADPIACDAYATTLFGLEPHELQSTVIGHEFGLGEIDLAKVRLVKA